MSMISVFTDTLKADKLRDYQEAIGQLAAEARKKDEAWKWTAHQTLFGDVSQIHYVSQVENFAAIQARGTVDDMIQRVLGEKRGEKMAEDARDSVISSQQTLSIQRPDLSYPTEPDGTQYPAALITAVQIRPGHQDAVEQLIRKITEAIPKTGEPIRLGTYQTLLGDINVLWSVRPLQDLSELDKQSPPEELLAKAFGEDEARDIYRKGGLAVTQVQRSVTLYIEELSNPPA